MRTPTIYREAMATPVEAAIIATAFATVAAWSLAFVSAMKLVGLRAAHVTLLDLTFRGAAFFDPGNFRPEAAPWLRRFRVGFLGFFATVFLGAGLGLFLAGRGG